jgi:catechol 2,3-dioxygenase-like lactoylglutathione lyase family enzyme
MLPVKPQNKTTVSTTQPRPPSGSQRRKDQLMDYRLEVIGIPVSDVDASKSFYSDVLGFAVDHDISPGPGMRVVQLTPRGSPCSIVIGEGMPLGEPGTTKGAQLVVDDLDVAREELLSRGLQITDVQQLGREGAPGSRFAFFSDPDGNGWSIQEFKR